MITLDLNILKDPTIYEQNRLPHHADFTAYASVSETEKKRWLFGVRRSRIYIH